MTWEWKIGDPVDDATGGSMDAMNWGHGGDDDERSDHPKSRVDEYSKKAWDLYMNYNEVEALRYINRALDLDRNHAGNWNIKAIILEGMKRYADSEICYDKSLEFSPQNRVYDNKARMLYDWAGQLLEESKKQPNGLIRLNDALDKVLKAMNTLPGEGSEENLDKYLRLRDSIKFYIGYENEFQRKCEILYKYDKSELFTITATRFFKNGKGFREGMALELIREPDNEFDRDAIAVYADGEKVGYVANSGYTAFSLTSKASELQGVCRGEYLFYLDRYAEVQFHIGRISSSRQPSPD